MAYGKLYIITHYLLYLANAESWRSVQSPFNFKLAKTIANDKMEDEFKPIEKLRKSLLKNRTEISVTDFGKEGLKSNKKISKIASNSLKSKKYARLLYRLVKLINPTHILELGTSFGMSTAYMSIANPKAKVVSIEGSEAISKIAQENFSSLQLENIHQVTGSFENTLSSTLNYMPQLDFVFIDGHHQKKATLKYFEMCLTKSHTKTLFIFDDINWSEEMQEAWSILKQHPQSTLTIDIFMMGLVFVNPGLSKQNIELRY
ncbi:MAG: class I SAM-dependent methyltransferase [Bacteroidia bacterium]|nr:class I SAM-dependent methyltransferase [Bacteroidia bacterium]